MDTELERDWIQRSVFICSLDKYIQLPYNNLKERGKNKFRRRST